MHFIISVTTDIYERIDKITYSLEAVKISLNELINNLNDNLSKITKTIMIIVS